MTCRSSTCWRWGNDRRDIRTPAPRRQHLAHSLRRMGVDLSREAPPHLRRPAGPRTLNRGNRLSAEESLQDVLSSSRGEVVTAVTTAEALRLIAKSKRTALEDRLLADLAKLGLPVPEREYRFHPVRRFRFDLCYPGHKLGIECDGG